MFSGRLQFRTPSEGQEGYNSTATGRQEDILGLLDKDQTGSMNDTLGKDDNSDDPLPLRVLAPSLHASRPIFSFYRVI
jgi:hypothetical protein